MKITNTEKRRGDSSCDVCALLTYSSADTSQGRGDHLDEHGILTDTPLTACASRREQTVLKENNMRIGLD